MQSVEELLELAKKCTLFKELEVKWIMQKLIEILQKEPNVKFLPAGITVVGDIHGLDILLFRQFPDLMEMFSTGGEVPHTNYLFLGDYVDRGAFSVEVIVYLSLLKIKYPSKIHLLRGNHESRQTSNQYGFFCECMRKYNSPNTWKYITEMFDYMPISAVIDNKIFCIHGGLSPLIQKISEIEKITRFQELPTEGPLADLMWSDPDETVEGFKISARGAGYIFGESVVKKFLHVNNMETIIRAHQLCMDGYQTLFGGKIITVWSAPNYCYRFYNLASILEIDENLNKNFNIFEDAECLVSNEEKRKEGNKASEMDKYFM